MQSARRVAAHVVFSGGGTGGHLFPGFAVAQQMQKLAAGVHITFAGTSKPLERHLVRSAGHEHLAIACRPMLRGVVEAFRFLAANFNGYRTAGAFLDAHGVSAVVGLGGYASVPMAKAAVARGIPLVLLEQNAVPGRATRHLAPQASLVCAAFEQVREQLRVAGPLRLTGTPIRGQQGTGHNEWSGEHLFDDSRRLLLVLGGSQGARSLNRSVPRALHAVRGPLVGWRIVHQTGDGDSAATSGMYRGLGIDAQVVPFIQHLPRLLRHANLVLSRAGGTTLAELAAAGAPAVLAPYPFASDAHQLRNAQAFVARGACRMVDEGSSDGHLHEQIAAALGDLLANSRLRETMGKAMKGLARIDAAWHVARMTLELASSQRRRAA